MSARRALIAACLAMSVSGCLDSGLVGETNACAEGCADGLVCDPAQGACVPCVAADDRCAEEAAEDEECEDQACEPNDEGVAGDDGSADGEDDEEPEADDEAEGGGGAAGDDREP